MLKQPDHDAKNFPARFREARAFMGWSEEQAARETGLSVHDVRLIERGRFPLAQWQVDRIARAFDLPQLFFWASDEIAALGVEGS